MTRLRADLLLFLVAIIWGTAFIAQKVAMHGMGPLAFSGMFCSHVARTSATTDAKT